MIAKLRMCLLSMDADMCFANEVCVFRCRSCGMERARGGARVPKSARSLSLSSARRGPPLYNDARTTSEPHWDVFKAPPRRSRSGGPPPRSLLRPCCRGGGVGTSALKKKSQGSAASQKYATDSGAAYSAGAAGNLRRAKRLREPACAITTPCDPVAAKRDFDNAVDTMLFKRPRSEDQVRSSSDEFDTYRGCRL